MARTLPESVCKHILDAAGARDHESTANLNKHYKRPAKSSQKLQARGFFQGGFSYKKELSSWLLLSWLALRVLSLRSRQDP